MKTMNNCKWLEADWCHSPSYYNEHQEKCPFYLSGCENCKDYEVVESETKDDLGWRIFKRIKNKNNKGEE